VSTRCKLNGVTGLARNICQISIDTNIMPPFSTSTQYSEKLTSYQAPKVILQLVGFHLRRTKEYVALKRLEPPYGCPVAFDFSSCKVLALRLWHNRGSQTKPRFVESSQNRDLESSQIPRFEIASGGDFKSSRAILISIFPFTKPD
jgi:hypothetical protein